MPLTESLQAALVRGTSIGGARPKVLVTDGEAHQWIAKLSASSDAVFSVVNAEAAAMELARGAGIEVPETQVVRSLGREVLLVRRFDRAPDGTRRHVVSGLTMAQEHELGARYVGYPDLLDVLREYGSRPETVGSELFDRIVFNMAISNTDDHARNHAAFWDGRQLSLTPAFDLVPGPRSGETAAQAMAIDRQGTRLSSFAAALSAAHVYGLSERQARERIDRIVESVRAHWSEAAEVGRLTVADRTHLWNRQFLNPGIFHGYSAGHM